MKKFMLVGNVAEVIKNIIDTETKSISMNILVEHIVFLVGSFGLINLI